MKSRRTHLLALLLSLALALPAVAAVAPDGSQFLVHRTANSAQENPVAAYGPGGVSLVVWSDVRHGIQAQLYGASGAPTGHVFDLVANRAPGVPGNGPAVFAREPVVAFGTSGDFVLLWAQEEGHLRVEPFYQHFELASRRVMARRFRLSGQPAGPVFAVSDSTDLLESWPKVHALSNGWYLAAWRSASAGGEDGELIARHLGASARPRGGEIALSGGRDGDYVAFAEAAGGKVLVAWEGCCDAGGDLGIHSRLYDSASRSFGPSEQINLETSQKQRRPSIAVAGERGFLVVWQGIIARSEGHIFGRFVAGDGQPDGAQFLVSEGHGPVQVAPAVAAKPDGGFVAVWRDWIGVVFGVSAVELDAAGVPTGAPFRVSTGKTQKSGHTTLATDGAGGFLVPWEQAVGPRPAIQARRLQAE